MKLITILTFISILACAQRKQYNLSLVGLERTFNGDTRFGLTSRTRKHRTFNRNTHVSKKWIKSVKPGEKVLDELKEKAKEKL